MVVVLLIGRGGNVWLSPKGCMMFSAPLQFPIDSRLGRTASIVQHIAALSVVTAVRRQSGYEVSNNMYVHVGLCTLPCRKF